MQALLSEGPRNEHRLEVHDPPPQTLTFEPVGGESCVYELAGFDQLPERHAIYVHAPHLG